MRTLLVGYDLNRPGPEYEPLWDRLRAFETWWRHLDSTWLIRTTLTPRQLHDLLAPLLDANDELLIIEVTAQSWWSRGFSSRALTWLHRYL